MKQNKQMLFETKMREPEEVRRRFYTIAIVYWVAIPLLFFFMLKSANSQASGGVEALVAANPSVVFEMLAQFSNIILAGLLFLIGDNQRTKNGEAGMVLKVAIGQQLFIGNFFGIVVSFLAYRELPRFGETNENGDSKKTINKTGVLVLLGVLIVVSLVVGYGRWVMSN